jgi:hypothetical protein
MMRYRQHGIGMEVAPDTSAGRPQASAMFVLLCNRATRAADGHRYARGCHGTI